MLFWTTSLFLLQRIPHDEGKGKDQESLRIDIDSYGKAPSQGIIIARGIGIGGDYIASISIYILCANSYLRDDGVGSIGSSCKCMAILQCRRELKDPSCAFLKACQMQSCIRKRIQFFIMEIILI